jgi:integrase
VNVIVTQDVQDILEPIWIAKPATAGFVRVAIEAVLDAAKSKGFRTTDNPARLKGHLAHLLGKRPRLSRGHHRAMPYAEVGAFVTELRQREAVSALALEFLILTAARAGEVRGARWSEIDLESKVWIVPPERTKTATEHRVPLSKRAVEIVKEMAKAKVSEFVFPGQRRGKLVKAGSPLSSSAIDSLLLRVGSDCTVHGFRSSFRDWAGEVSTFPREVAEAALGHVVGDQSERAYRRGDALQKRARMMEAWSGYVAKPTGSNVEQFGRRAARA